MSRITTVLILLYATSVSYSQKTGDVFINKGCGYINFVNDSIVDFVTIGGPSGATADFVRGIGIYELKRAELTIHVIDNSNQAGYLMHKNTASICGEMKEMKSGTLKFKMISISNDSIRLTGPIMSDYKKLNQKRFFRGFFNWPWRWSFRAQHWFDPQEIILIKE